MCLYLPAAGLGQAPPDDRVVGPNDIETSIVTELIADDGRSFNVGEHDGAQSGIRAGSWTVYRGSIGGFGLPVAQERREARLFNPDDVVRHQAVSFLVTGLGGVGAWGIDKAVCFAFGTVEPVGEVTDAVLVLDLEIARMCCSDVFFCRFSEPFVNIHKHWHGADSRDCWLVAPSPGVLW